MNAIINSPHIEHHRVSFKNPMSAMMFGNDINKYIDFLKPLGQKCVLDNLKILD